jgi:cellobiose dehydrogenase (acceptor)
VSVAVCFPVYTRCLISGGWTNSYEAASKCASHPANLSVLLLEAGGPSYAIVGNTDHPAWLNGANISRVDCPGLYNSIFDSSVSSKQSLLCTGAINAFGGCTVGGSTAINAGLYFVPPDADWDSWEIDAWSSKNIQQSAAALQSIIGSGEIVTSSDGQLYLQSSYNAMSKWLAASNYTEVNINAQASYNSKSKVLDLPCCLKGCSQV